MATRPKDDIKKGAELSAKNSFYYTYSSDERSAILEAILLLSDVPAIGRPHPLDAAQDADQIIAAALEIAAAVGAMPNFYLWQCECGRYFRAFDDTASCEECSERVSAETDEEIGGIQ